MNVASPGRNSLLACARRDYLLYLLCLPAVAYLIVFKYIPMYGITIAFKDYNLFRGIIKSDWAGIAYFRQIFSDKSFWFAVRNTLTLNLLVLAVSFPATIILSLFLNEIGSALYRRIAQSLLYLPHFISWVVVAGLLQNMLSVKYGSVNYVLTRAGFQPIPFMIEENWWIFTYVLAELWKSLGWGTIIYLAALSGVNESLYESAYMDGANKRQRIWYITIPSIKPTIVIMLILSISKMMTIGLDAPLLLQNAKVLDVAEVISTYVYKMGLERVQYSFATAVGLFQSLVNIILLVIANAITRAMGEEGIL